jgi:hypothetical protein
MMAVWQAMPMFRRNRRPETGGCRSIDGHPSFGGGNLTRRILFLRSYLNPKKESIMKRMILGAALVLLLTAGLLQQTLIQARKPKPSQGVRISKNISKRNTPFFTTGLKISSEDSEEAVK